LKVSSAGGERLAEERDRLADRRVGGVGLASRTSASAVITSAGGSPARCSRVARRGEAVISLRCGSSVVYWSQNHGMASRRR